MLTCTYTHIYKRIYIDTYVFMQLHSHTYIHIYIHTYVHVLYVHDAVYIMKRVNMGARKMKQGPSYETVLFTFKPEERAEASSELIADSLDSCNPV